VALDGRADVEAVARFAQRTAETLVARDPEHLTLAFSKAERHGRLFLDTGRNTYSATYAAPYALRALPGAPVSAPCAWSELGRIRPQSVTLRTMAARLAAVGDPWADLRAQPATLP